MASCTCGGFNPNCFKCGGWGQVDSDIGKRRGNIDTIPISPAKNPGLGKSGRISSGHCLGIKYPSSSTTTLIRKKRPNKHEQKIRRELRNADFKRRVQANLDKNYQRHKKATTELCRLTDLQAPWLQETGKVNDIKQWISKLEDWIREDERKLKIKKHKKPRKNKTKQKRKTHTNTKAKLKRPSRIRG